MYFLYFYLQISQASRSYPQSLVLSSSSIPSSNTSHDISTKTEKLPRLSVVTTLRNSLILFNSTMEILSSSAEMHWL